MDKLLLFSGKSDKGIFTYVIDAEKSYLEKTAAEYHPTIAAYINSAKTIPGKTQLLITALGAGEFWGDNANGDFFPEEALAHEGSDYGYKTFVTDALIYKHHINKDRKRSYGDVLLAVYNPVYHRVELIVAVDHAKAPDVAQKIAEGDYPDWSMGCKVPYDVCSICGNKAPTRKQYCDHLRYYLGRIHPETGKKAYAINTKPKFFDISIVLIPADKTAKTLKKVASLASAPQAISSAYLAEKMAATKAADIKKEVPVKGAPSSQAELKETAEAVVKAMADVKAHEAPLPDKIINGLSAQPLSRVLSTMTMLGMVPKPQEFQKIYLISIGKRDLAESLAAKNLCFDPMMVEEPSSKDYDTIGVDHRNFDPLIMQMLLPFMAERSYAAPHLGRRMTILVKSAAEPHPAPTFVSKDVEKGRKPLPILPVLVAAAGAYAALARKAPKESLKGIDKLLSSNAGLGLAAALGIGLISAFGGSFGAKAKGEFTPGKYENPDANDVFQRIEAMKQKPYLKVAGVSNLGAASKRLFLGIPAAYMASGVLQKHREINPYDEEGRVRRFIRQYPDVLSGALIADAVLSAKGHPLSSASMFGKAKGAFKHLGGAAKHMAKAASAAEELLGEDFFKTADAQEMLSNALIWPLAIGKANLPGRIVGGMFDQGVIDVSKRILERRKKQPSDQKPAKASD